MNNSWTTMWKNLNLILVLSDQDSDLGWHCLPSTRKSLFSKESIAKSWLKVGTVSQFMIRIDGAIFLVTFSPDEALESWQYSNTKITTRYSLECDKILSEPTHMFLSRCWQISRQWMLVRFCILKLEKPVEHKVQQILTNNLFQSEKSSKEELPRFKTRFLKGLQGSFKEWVVLRVRIASRRDESDVVQTYVLHKWRQKTDCKNEMCKSGKNIVLYIVSRKVAYYNLPTGKWLTLIKYMLRWRKHAG